MMYFYLPAKLLIYGVTIKYFALLFIRFAAYYALSALKVQRFASPDLVMSEIMIMFARIIFLSYFQLLI